MKRLLAPALLTLVAACADPAAEEMSVTRSDLPDLTCVQSELIESCPQPAQPGFTAKAGQTAANMGASLTRSLMRLF